MKCSRTRVLEESVEVALLRAQRLARGEEPFDEATALGAVAAEAALAHEHREADRPLGRVVRRLDALDIDECEERRLQLEHLAAHAADLGDGQSFAFFEQREDLAPHGSSRELELSARHGSVADAVPHPEQLPALGEQALTEALRRGVVVEEGLEVPRQVAPAELP